MYLHRFAAVSQLSRSCLALSRSCLAGLTQAVSRVSQLSRAVSQLSRSCLAGCLASLAAVSQCLAVSRSCLACETCLAMFHMSRRSLAVFRRKLFEIRFWYTVTRQLLLQVSQLSRSVSRCLADVSRVSHRVSHMSRSCLADVSQLFRRFHTCESV